MKKLFLSLILSSFILPSMAFAGLSEEGDVQWWSTNVIGGPISDNVKVDLEAEFRVGDDISDFYYTHSQVQIHFKLADWFTFSPVYREVFEKKNGEWTSEHRPLLNGTLKHTWEGWGLSSRARVEFRMKEESDNTIRFRNKFTIKLPVHWTEWDIRPYIADEIFVESDGKGFNRNRLYVGIGFDIIENVKGGLFYLWQTTDKSNDWINIHAIGMKLKVYF